MTVCATESLAAATAPGVAHEPREPRVRFILIEPSHAGNVGAVARAIKVMGFADLALVRPRWPNVLARKEAIERASGATDVLQAARVVATLDEALAGMTHLCATVMTPRDFGPPTFTPRAHFDALLADGSRPDAVPGWPDGIAFLFGTERYGMSNADVYRCHAALSIPSNPAFGSLNLAAAVQLIAYDWRQSLIARGLGYGAAGDADAASAAMTSTAATAVQRQRVADAAQVAGLLAHWQRALVHLRFLDPAAPKKLMPRLTQLFNRARPTVEEIDILRGIARSMEQATPHQPISR